MLRKRKEEREGEKGGRMVGKEGKRKVAGFKNKLAGEILCTFCGKIVLAATVWENEWLSSDC